MMHPLPNPLKHALPALAVLCLSTSASPAAELLRGTIKKIDPALRIVTLDVEGKGPTAVQVPENARLLSMRPIKLDDLKDGDLVFVLGKVSADQTTITPSNIRRLLPGAAGQARISPTGVRSATLRRTGGTLALDANGKTIRITGRPREIQEDVIVGFEDILPGQEASASGLSGNGGAFIAESLLAWKSARSPKAAFSDYEGDPALPNVLILGDSISMGYTLPVRAKLEAKANVFRPGENCFDTDVGLEKLDEWLGDKKWAVIHFNWGLHDVKYMLDGKLNFNGTIDTPLDRYEANLRLLVTRLQKTGARLIWASTTPVPADSDGRKSEDVPRYNAAAARVMKDLGVEINDLCAFVLPQHGKIMKKPGNVHYTDEGSELLAQQVAKTIEARLP